MKNATPNSDLNDDEIQTPVFLVSSIRSGSTLLALILNQHSRLCHVGETDFMFDGSSNNRSKEDLNKRKLELKTDRIFTSKLLTIPDIDDLSLFPNHFYSQFIANAKRLEKKTSSAIAMTLHRRYKAAIDAFPQAKFIHLIRDPRDVADSCLKMGVVGSHYRGAQVWLDALVEFKKLSQVVKRDNVIEVKYEDLVNEPIGELEKIFSFLSLPYEPTVLDFHHHSTYGPISPRLHNSWHTKLSNSQIEIIESQCNDDMKQYDYANVTKIIIPNRFKTLQWILRDKLVYAKTQIQLYGVTLYLLDIFARKLKITWLRSYCQARINNIVDAKLK